MILVDEPLGNVKRRFRLSVLNEGVGDWHQESVMSFLQHFDDCCSLTNKKQDLKEDCDKKLFPSTGKLKLLVYPSLVSLTFFKAKIS
jgi:hypothetical protein